MILMGHNGAGKSTFINYIIGFYTETSQHPFLDEFQKHFQPLKSGQFGYSPEIAVLDTNLNGGDYIQMVASLRGVKVDSKEVLDEVSLKVSPKTAILKYSKGMRQRLSVALSMIGNPEYIILDEPTSGLDIAGENIILDLLENRKDRFKYIISTHSQKIVDKLCDEDIWIFKGGEIVEKISR
jgi:ABC-2 type transport system ATP-binding protein